MHLYTKVILFMYHVDYKDKIIRANTDFCHWDQVFIHNLRFLVLCLHACLSRLVCSLGVLSVE